MKQKKMSLITLVLVVGLQRYVDGIPIAGNIHDISLQIRNLNAPVERNGGKSVFPKAIDGVADLAGLREIRFEASLVEDIQLPKLEELSEHGKKIINVAKKERAFYTGREGSFLVEAKNRGGRIVAEITLGLVVDGDQNCLLNDGRAYCAQRESGQELVLPVPGASGQKNHPSLQELNNTPPMVRMKRQESNNTPPVMRMKRHIEEPSNSTRIITLVVYVDQSFVDRFKAINGGSYTQAVVKIQEYIKLLSNEWTYRYQTVKQYPGGLDLSVDTVQIEIPPDGQDHSFVVKNGSTITYNETMYNFRLDAYQRSLTDYSSGIAVHAMLLIGTNMDTGYLGVAYVRTICNSPYGSYRVDITRDLDWNAANIGAHEVGHALDADHDGSDDGSACDSNSYLMGPYYNGVTSGTASIYYTFSVCSSDQFTNHLNTVGNCLPVKDSDFTTKFCEGPRGFLSAATLDEQCQWAQSPSTGWTVCDGITKVTADNCWQHNEVKCCNGESNDTISHVADGTPCIGANPILDYYCYLGQCVERNTICTTTTTPATTTTTPTTTTTTTLNNTTTTTTPTATTTTPDPCPCGTKISCRDRYCRKYSICCE